MCYKYCEDIQEALNILAMLFCYSKSNLSYLVYIVSCQGLHSTKLFLPQNTQVSLI